MQFTARIVITEADDAPYPHNVTLQIFTDQVIQLANMPFSDLCQLSDSDITDKIASNNVLTVFYQGTNIKQINIQ